jgi:hypothetical protein
LRNLLFGNIKIYAGISSNSFGKNLWTSRDIA